MSELRFLSKNAFCSVNSGAGGPVLRERLPFETFTIYSTSFSLRDFVRVPRPRPPPGFGPRHAPLLSRELSLAADPPERLSLSPWRLGRLSPSVLFLC